MDDSHHRASAPRRPEHRLERTAANPLRRPPRRPSRPRHRPAWRTGSDRRAAARPAGAPLRSARAASLVWPPCWPAGSPEPGALALSDRRIAARRSCRKRGTGRRSAARPAASRRRRARSCPAWSRSGPAGAADRGWSWTTKATCSPTTTWSPGHEVTLVLSTGRRVTADVIGSEPSDDIAVLRADRRRSAARSARGERRPADRPVGHRRRLAAGADRHRHRRRRQCPRPARHASDDPDRRLHQPGQLRRPAGRPRRPRRRASTPRSPPSVGALRQHRDRLRRPHRPGGRRGGRILARG